MANNEKVNKAFALYKKGKKLKDITKGTAKGQSLEENGKNILSNIEKKPFCSIM